MSDRIHYLNTDLDLASAADLTALAEALEARGLFSLHVTHTEEGPWLAALEVALDHTEPETTIAAMLAAVESLPGDARAAWAACTGREFNIGYECGPEPWGFEQGLSNALLARVAAAGASLRITIYPPAPAPAELREGG